MELELEVMIEVYMIFTKFEIDIPREDYDQIDSLRLRFKQMIDRSRTIGDQIADMKDDLYTELTAGIEEFQAEIIVFDEEFELKGPMVEGLPAKVASDRVSFHHFHTESLPPTLIHYV